jgi:hypothetical protein
VNLRRSALLSTLLVATLAVGCTAQSDEGGSTSSDIVVSLSNQVAVFDDHLEFDAPAAQRLRDSGVLGRIEAYAKNPSSAEPVFLVGNRSSDALAADGSIKADARNPKGYLRRALSFTSGKGGTLVVTTQPATLAEAIEDVKKNGFTTLGTRSIRPLDEGDSEMNFAAGDFEQTLSHAFGSDGGDSFDFDLSGKELWKKKLFSGGEAKVVLKRGKLSFKPMLDAKISIRHFSPQDSNAILSTSVVGELEFEASADGAYEFNRGDSLLNKSWGTVVGGVPLTLSVALNWKCGLGVSASGTASVGATANGALRAGAAYEGGQVKGILDPPTYSFERLGPTVDAKFDLNGRCDVIADFTVQLFDAAGPEASVDLYAQLGAHGTADNDGAHASATFDVGVDATVGGTLSPFGVKIADITMPPAHYEKRLYEGELNIGQ